MPGSNDTVAVIGGPGSGGGSIVSADLYVGGTPSHDGRHRSTLARTATSTGWSHASSPPVARCSQEKQNMGDMVGWIAFIEDSEGNRIGIQQPAEGK